MGKIKKVSSIPVRSTKENPLPERVLLSDIKNRATSRALSSELKKLSKANSMLLPYKPAKLYSAGNKLNRNWYIEYYYQIPGSSEYKRIKERFDINRVHTLAERLAYGKAIVKALNEKLEAGFNPFAPSESFTPAPTPEVQIKIKSQLYQIKTALSNQAPSNYAAASYTENYNRLVKFIEVSEMDRKDIIEFTSEEAKQYKKYLLIEKLAKKTINSTLSYLSQFWEVAIENKWTFQNPFKALPRLKKETAKTNDKPERFEPLTGEEIQKIFSGLKEEKQTDFIRFLALIFYAWARPIEITRLRVQDIELGRQLIRFKSGQTKNSKAAYVQIVPPLLQLLKQINLQDYSGDYFLFSDGYLPGKRQVSKHYALKHWKKFVKEGMNIQKDMYALKHTGNIEYLLNNKGKVDLKWQQMQNRHSSSTMTDRYNRALGAYFIEVGSLNYTLF